jgi:uncharacterized protein (DUF2235 family)
MKRIIICCDGTWNNPGDTADGSVVKTNVQKIFESVCNLDNQGIIQIKHYIEGVGTSGSRLRKIIDGATGKGIDDNILSAYKFLVWNYVKGDEIYLLGFSRGAYTARSVAGLIRNCGIIRNDDLNLINEAYKHYRERNKAEWKPDGAKSKAFREEFSVEAPIKFIGVWDTVGALGIPFSLFNLLNSNKYKFHDTTLSSSVDYAFHALAIDEKRRSFSPTLWRESKKTQFRVDPQILEQRWFSGVHSNIGGGYPEKGLSDLAFNWMVKKAAWVGLAFDPSYLTVHSCPNALGKLYNSFVFPFNLFKPAIRHISRDTELKEVIAESVFKRWQLDNTYRPSNLEPSINRAEMLPPPNVDAKTRLENI